MYINNTFQSDFFYWGDRNYVQGAHIIYGLFDALKCWEILFESFSATFRLVLKTQGRYVLYTDQEQLLSMLPNKDCLCANFKLSSRCKEYKVALINENHLITKRLPDDEEKLIATCTINREAKSISIADCLEERLITVIIALTKKLHREIVCDKKTHQWFIASTSLNLSETLNLTIQDRIAVQLINNVGNKMTKARIYIEDMPIGYICFYYQERK